MPPLVDLKDNDMAPTSMMTNPSPPSGIIYPNAVVCYPYGGYAYPGISGGQGSSVPMPMVSLQHPPALGRVNLPVSTAVPVQPTVSQPVTAASTSAPQCQQQTTPMTMVAMPTVTSPGTMTPIYVDAPPPPLQISVTQQMELIWHGEFDRLFSAFGWSTKWHLMPTTTPPTETTMFLQPSNLYMPNMQWTVFMDSAKVRFCCENCGHGWTSMKGRVSFWIHLDWTNYIGYVLFKLYGQQCKRCENGLFDHAMWYPEEVSKVIGNVYNCVGQMYYGFSRPPLRIERRPGKPREQHNASLCQACQDGVCRAEVRYKPI